MHDSTTERYRAWLRAVFQESRQPLPPAERLVFRNAWNEWGEGSHPEPDQLWGRAYVEVTLRAIPDLDADAEPELARDQHAAV